jgi:hypothetical protein
MISFTTPSLILRGVALEFEKLIRPWASTLAVAKRQTPMIEVKVFFMTTMMLDWLKPGDMSPGFKAATRRRSS